jgi:hypothetical protein
MLKMNLITRKELYGDLYWELYSEVCGELRWGLNWELWRELYWGLDREVREEVRGQLGFPIHTDFSHSKISRV